MQYQKNNILLVFLALLLIVFSESCNKDTIVNSPNINSDIPVDPGTAPPVYMSGPLKPAIGLEITPGNADRIRLNIGGVLDPETHLPIEYSAANLTVVEDSIVQGIKISAAGTQTLGIDMVFLIDVTGSMQTEINGVTNSVLGFIDSLRNKHLDIRCGVVAFADNKDIRIPESINGIHDSLDPGAFAIVQYRNLDTNLSEAGPIYRFIDTLTSSYLGYSGGDTPEGCFDALWYAYSNFDWRQSAQKIFIVITDAPSWGKYAPVGSGTSRSPWRTDSLAAVLSGNATVHTVSPSSVINFDNNVNGHKMKMEFNNDNTVLGNYDVKYLSIPGTFTQNGVTYNSNGTGGTWTVIPSNGYINLNELPIAGVTSHSSLVEFVTNKPHGTTKTVRVVVKINSTKNGEVSIISTY